MWFEELTRYIYFLRLKSTEIWLVGYYTIEQGSLMWITSQGNIMKRLPFRYNDRRDEILWYIRDTRLRSTRPYLAHTDLHDIPEKKFFHAADTCKNELFSYAA